MFQIVSGEKGSKKRGRRERKQSGKRQNEHGKRGKRLYFEAKNAGKRGSPQTALRKLKIKSEK